MSGFQHAHTKLHCRAVEFPLQKGAVDVGCCIKLILGAAVHTTGLRRPCRQSAQLQDSRTRLDVNALLEHLPASCSVMDLMKYYPLKIIDVLQLQTLVLAHSVLQLQTTSIFRGRMWSVASRNWMGLAMFD